MVLHRDLSGTLLNIYDGTICENSYQHLAANYFRKKLNYRCLVDMALDADLLQIPQRVTCLKFTITSFNFEYTFSMQVGPTPKLAS